MRLPIKFSAILCPTSLLGYSSEFLALEAIGLAMVATIIQVLT